MCPLVGFALNRCDPPTLRAGGTAGWDETPAARPSWAPARADINPGSRLAGCELSHRSCPGTCSQPALSVIRHICSSLFASAPGPGRMELDAVLTASWAWNQGGRRQNITKAKVLPLF